MASSLNGTGVTFSNGSAQSIASAINSTSDVASACAGLSVGTVGTYAALYAVSGPYLTAGATISGTNVYYTGFGGLQYQQLKPAGTWRCMGNTGETAGGVTSSTVFLRIS